MSLLLVNVGEDPRTVQRAVRERGYDVPVLLDSDDKALRAFGITATPTVVLVGRAGTVLGAAIGPRSWAERESRARRASRVQDRPVIPDDARER